MEKLKQNKIWITIVVIGVVVIAILLAMLHQQKQSTPEAQSSSYIASEKASSASTSVQDTNNEKVYAKKAAKMKGHVYNDYFTTWTKQDFINWANNYLAKPESERHQDGVKESFGTSNTVENSRIDMPLDDIAKQIKTDGYPENYYETVKAYNKDYAGMNPDDIKK
ncbi:hypothetical protein [Leuconostoc rapi]|uniref:hypothetical protein n=1 Tax=Leuconostoc rapi TaxID=1406906 RepID=UPI00195833F8|nr:hypothetical protein [Leuconostoc rapi]MBM7435701.1 hypothetical protein [Leuconostoc rapi]